MKLTINRNILSAALNQVSAIPPSRSTLPILQNVCLDGFEGRLGLSVSNLDQTMSLKAEAIVAQTGRCTVHLGRLRQVIGELPKDSEVSLEVNGTSISLSSGSSRFKLNGIDAEEFPKVPTDTKDLAPKASFSFMLSRLKAMLNQISYAISTDEIRFVLNGVYFVAEKGELSLVATDGRRLALAKEPLPMDVSFIVPAKAIAEVAKLTTDDDFSVVVGYNDSKVWFSTANTLLTSKLIEGNYPNYRQVIPKECKERVQFLREELLKATRRAAIMTSDKATSVRFSFTKNLLTLTANCPDVGSSSETLPINYDGKEMSIAFNPAYLTDCLSALTEETVTMELVDELSPGVLKAEGAFLYVVMPMRLS